MIVVTVREQAVAAARLSIAGLGRTAGAVELRLDDLARQDWHRLIASSPLPVVATCRSKVEGGSFEGSEEERLGLLRSALAAGARYADIEAGAPADLFLGGVSPDQVVVSVHDFETGATRLEHHLERLRLAPPGCLLKLAFTPRHVSDCLIGREILRRASREGRRLALVPMGEAGLPGRILANSWGSIWSYAAPDGSPPAAPGQLSLTEMADLYDVDGIGPATVLTGLLGWPITESLSPWMHNRAAKEAGLDARYLLFPEKEAADLLMNLTDWRLAGIGVTQPHKETVLKWVDDIGPAARACGAINTLLARDGRLWGENTDAEAGVAAIKAALPSGGGLGGRRVAIVGAGGAARALAWGVTRHGGEVTLYGRDRVRVGATASALGVASRHLADLAADSADIVVNATPAGSGLEVGVSPVRAEALGGELVFDLVTNPPETRLMSDARARGLATAGGLGMLIRQGEAQFRLWHGLPAPPGAFMAAAREGHRHLIRGSGSRTTGPTGGPSIMS